ncbi:Hypothetical protein CINCED_3A022290 [Cinara cedri]|uniref:Uncharacterized protein n=1 Tax=Cinara cedri TaxID=506608 RepID=A0A5E4MSX4_9HEMI|nr:Hypothetical protein CINCED_3A022290 [Cinara cedri]
MEKQPPEKFDDLVKDAGTYSSARVRYALRTRLNRMRTDRGRCSHVTCEQEITRRAIVEPNYRQCIALLAKRESSVAPFKSYMRHQTKLSDAMAEQPEH